MDDLSVGASVCMLHRVKTADQIRMPFGIIGWTGPRMRQVVGFGDRSTGRGTFGDEFGAHYFNQCGIYGLRVRQWHYVALFPNYFGQTCYHYRRLTVINLGLSTLSLNYLVPVGSILYSSRRLAQQQSSISWTHSPCGHSNLFLPSITQKNSDLTFQLPFIQHVKQLEFSLSLPGVVLSGRTYCRVPRSLPSWTVLLFAHLSVIFPFRCRYLFSWSIQAKRMSSRFVLNVTSKQFTAGIHKASYIMSSSRNPHFTRHPALFAQHRNAPHFRPPDFPCTVHSTPCILYVFHATRSQSVRMYWFNGRWKVITMSAVTP